MDALKRQIMKARKASKVNSQDQKLDVTLVKERYELDEMFSGQYISESMGMYSKEIIVNCQSNKREYLNQSLDNTKHRNKRSAILEYRRQYEQAFSEPLRRKEKEKKIMEIELNTSCQQEQENEELVKGNIGIDVVQKQSEVKDQSKSQSSMSKKRKSQNTVVNQQIMPQKVQKQQNHEEQAYNISGEKSFKTCPWNPSQQPSGTKTSKSYITDSVYHNEDSVWKKYLIEDVQWQHPTTTQQSFPELNPIEQLEKQTESAPAQPEHNKIAYNQSFDLIKERRQIPEVQNIQPEPNRKSQKQKAQPVDLMTLDQMREHYDSYSPVFFPEEEIEMFISALDNTEYEQSCINYLDKVYEEYHKNGGTMLKKQVQQKIVCDLMFVIRQENLKCCFKNELS